MQTQAFFTVIFVAIVFRELPTPRQIVGMALAGVGLMLIGLTIGHGLTGIGFGLTLGSAVSWAIGNVWLKSSGEAPTVNLIVWLSLVPPIPSLGLSALLDGAAALPHAVARASWPGLGAAVYLGLFATVLAYVIWARLLWRYPAATVTPFALLVPYVAAAGSSIVFAERFGPLRLAGMAAVLLGLVVTTLPSRAAR